MTKVRVAELTQRLRDAAKLQDPVASSAIELVKLVSDELKESLVDAVGDDMLRVQGAARRMAKLHKDLITTPPSIVPVGRTGE